MLERLAVPEAPALLERLLDRRVGVEHALAAEQLGTLARKCPPGPTGA